MGIGPVVAIPMALKTCGLALNDVDLFEVGFSFHLRYFVGVQLIDAAD